MATMTQETENAAGVLALLRADRTDREAAEVRQLVHTIEWAVLHEVDDDNAPATYIAAWGDTGMDLAGPGAPRVAEFALYEYAAALGMTSDAGKLYVGRALELRYRLTRLWGRVLAGGLPVWRAGRIAEHTICLPPEAAAHVDRHLAAVAHKVSWAQVERLVEEALVRWAPDQALERRRSADEARHVTIGTDQASFDGTVHVDAELDLADALDLDQALSCRAAELAALGSTESLDVRRASAVGDLARGQLTLGLGANGVVSTSSTTSRRQVVIYVHLSDVAVGRCENTRSPISVEQVRSWCTNPDTQVVIKPVINLAGHDRVDAYEIPDRLCEAVGLRDGHCVFPFCTRPARRCDCDHTIPHNRGGPTCTCNLAPLCRRHHRAKTHSAWTYTAIEPGVYLWTSPHGYQFLRDHHGTVDLTYDRWCRQARPPDE